MSIFSQDSSPVKVRAGDVAPDIVWTKSLGSSAGKYEPGSLSGHVTVILFCPYVSGNESLVKQWNELVSTFADKPVNFVWMSSEDSHTLEPWLRTHTVNGWLLFDPEWETARAYGIEGGDSPIVGGDGRIAGFDSLNLREAEIAAILDGKPPHLNAEPSRMPRPEGKPDLPPSYEVHISPTRSEGTVANTGPDYWIQRGFDLKAVMAMVYEIDESRIDIPASLEDGKRYDFVLVLPREEDQKAINRLVQQGIEKYFRVSVTHEKRMTDVFVMTALPGKTRQAKDPEAFGGAVIGTSSEWVEIVPKDGAKPPTIEEMRQAAHSSMSRISAYNSSMDDFRRILEDGLNRPIIDETNMHGYYDLVVRSTAKGGFVAAMREQVGLVLQEAQRPIDMLVVTSYGKYLKPAEPAK